MLGELNKISVTFCKKIYYVITLILEYIYNLEWPLCINLQSSYKIS